jgi:hypothetical protein
MAILRLNDRESTEPLENFWKIAPVLRVEMQNDDKRDILIFRNSRQEPLQRADTASRGSNTHDRTNSPGLLSTLHPAAQLVHSAHPPLPGGIVALHVAAVNKQLSDYFSTYLPIRAISAQRPFEIASRGCCPAHRHAQFSLLFTEKLPMNRPGPWSDEVVMDPRDIEHFLNPFRRIRGFPFYKLPIESLHEPERLVGRWVGNHGYDEIFKHDNWHFQKKFRY